MAKQIRVVRSSGEAPQIHCPCCDELIEPVKNQIGLDGYDCPECNQVIQSNLLKAYRKALQQYEEGEENG